MDLKNSLFNLINISLVFNLTNHKLAFTLFSTYFFSISTRVTRIQITLHALEYALATLCMYNRSLDDADAAADHISCSACHR